MFESVFLGADGARDRQVTQSRLLSLAAHGVAAVLLLTLQFAATHNEFPSVATHLVLLAPSLPPAHELVPAALPASFVRKAAPRRFRGFPAPAARLTAPLTLDFPVAPTVEWRQPSLPPIELSRIPLPPSPPPAPKLNQFSADPAIIAGATSHVKSTIQPAGFADASFTANGGERSRTIAVGDAFLGADVVSVAARAGSFVSAGFGETSVATGARAASLPSLAGVKPVEIVSKPRPAYSDEARRLRIEGDVLVELLFSAAGEARVLRLVQGLGHGLDESAEAAARGIRFHPAQRGGMPVDFTAVVRIAFQLAY